MATQPVVFSHSNPKSLRQHGRNITDDQIRACAKTGGVIGVNGIGLFLPQRASSAEAMVDCIVYIRDLVGPEYVGIGLDYGPPMPPAEDPIVRHPDFWPPSEYAQHWPMEDAAPAVFARIAALLLARGWSESDVRKVLGENFLRVARAVRK